MPNCKHFWRIHARVAKRLWSDLTIRERKTIAADVDHTSEEFQWFDAKVKADAQRLFEDPNYYDNNEFTFRYGKNEYIGPAKAVAA